MYHANVVTVTARTATELDASIQQHIDERGSAPALLSIASGGYWLFATLVWA